VTRAARRVPGASRPAVGGVWTRALGLSLVRTTREAVAAAPALLRAAADVTDRRSAPLLPDFPGAADWYEVREAARPVGVAIVQRDHPRPGAATLLGVAVAREQRGRSCAIRALLAAERRLAAEGYAPMFARVPRTNGRGLYFMLRAGFTPVPAAARPDDPGDATWFARRGSL
jgi:GNAT superfamily N-acetyltransferase